MEKIKKENDESSGGMKMDEGTSGFGLMIIICANKLKTRSKAGIGPKSLKISATSSGSRSSIAACINPTPTVSNNPQ